MNEKLRKLLDKNIYIGTSSWKYEGWKGLVYAQDYSSDKAFKDRCLEEYAKQYTAVGVDHTYYTWPTTTQFERYMDQTPTQFRFGLKVTEKITVFKYPNLKRYGKEAGKINEGFLDPKLFEEKFLTPILSAKEKIGPLMLEFSQFYPGTLTSGSEFVSRLDRFFTDLKLGRDFQMGVELRNRNWLKPAYFEMLSRHHVSHVYNSWSRMPSLPEQLELSKDYSFPYIVSRMLLQPGTLYDEAVEAFSPYDKLIEPSEELRKSGADLIRKAIQKGISAYLFVNNRAEGCAPKTIEAILAQLSEL